MNKNKRHLSGHKVSICFEDWGLYNEGYLNTKWWPAGTKAEEVQEFLQKRRSKAGVLPVDDLEIFVSDFELTWPGEITSPPEIISEHCGLDDALNILALFNAADDDELRAAAFLLSEGLAEEFQGALDKAQDVHIIWHNPYGEGKEWTGSTPEETLGYYWADNGLIEIPDHVESYFDYKKLGRELLQGEYKYFAGHIYTYNN